MTAITITASTWQQCKENRHSMSGGLTHEKNKKLEEFLSNVEKKAFVIAKLAVNNPDDALELVQEAMFKLVQLYSDKPATQWTALFYKILQSRIRDWYRRNKVRNGVFGWFKHYYNQQPDEDPIAQVAANDHNEPDRQMQTTQANEALFSALKQLSNRQQQVFLLRAWQGLNVAEAAIAMGCSAGSVKTHYSRAVHSLREIMKEWQ